MFFGCAQDLNGTGTCMERHLFESPIGAYAGHMEHDYVLLEGF